MVPSVAMENCLWDRGLYDHCLWDCGGLALYHNCTTIRQTEQDSPQYHTHAPKYNICPLYLHICMQTLQHFSHDSIRMHLWIQYMTCSHKMSLNLKSGNLRYLHVSNLQVLLIILILKSCFYSKKCGCDVLLKVARVVEAILRKSVLKFALCIE